MAVALAPTVPRPSAAASSPPFPPIGHSLAATRGTRNPPLRFFVPLWFPALAPPPVAGERAVPGVPHRLHCTPVYVGHLTRALSRLRRDVRLMKEAYGSNRRYTVKRGYSLRAKETYARRVLDALSVLPSHDLRRGGAGGCLDVVVLYAHKTCHAERRPVDPQTTWEMLCDALHELDVNRNDADARARAIELLDSLAHWLRMGGVPRTWSRRWRRWTCKTGWKSWLSELAEEEPDRAIIIECLQRLAGATLETPYLGLRKGHARRSDGRNRPV